MRPEPDRQTPLSRLLQRFALALLLASAVVAGAATWFGPPAGTAARPAAHPPTGTWVEAWIRSGAVAGAREVLAYLPPSYLGAPWRNYPAVYFLHGGPGQVRDWMTKGRIGSILDALERARRIPESIAILPDASGPARLGRSLYVDSYDGRSRMEDFVAGDLVRWVDRHFRTRSDAASRFLVGISDGGGAALNLAFHHPDRFGGCAGLSGEYLLPSGADLASVLGDATSAVRIRSANSPLLYLASAPPASRPARIYFDCGWFDPAIGDGVQLDRRLDRLGVAHEFHSYPGSHGWSWWRSRVSIALTYLFARPAVPASGPRAWQASRRPAPAPGAWRLPRRPGEANVPGPSAHLGRDRGGP
jgi:enterochelin esterase-like enzyme